MSRAERLLQLIQVLRRYRLPVSAQTLADELATSLRTVYRDIDALRSQGAHIEGEAGVGYVLRPGFILPPLMFSEDEIEALVLGSRWVAERADKRLAAAARNALAKITAVLPDDLREEAETSTLLIGPGETVSAGDLELAAIREAIRTEHKLNITYQDASGAETKRLVWPIALAFFERVRVVVAWCEARQDFRHFRADRILSLTPTAKRFPRRRTAMLKEWRILQGIESRDHS